jgi:hypothetical protein
VDASRKLEFSFHLDTLFERIVSPESRREHTHPDWASPLGGC